MIPGNLPEYVERGGRQVWRAPYTARRAKLFGFVLDASAESIDLLLDRDFNDPAGNAVDYCCAHPSVVIVFGAIDRLASGDPRDQGRGYLTELEVSVWCLAADTLAGNRLVWYMPYVFVDPGQAVASGREVYGYTKQMGIFEPNYPDNLERVERPPSGRWRSIHSDLTRRRSPARRSRSTMPVAHMRQVGSATCSNCSWAGSGSVRSGRRAPGLGPRERSPPRECRRPAAPLLAASLRGRGAG